MNCDNNLNMHPNHHSVHKEPLISSNKTLSLSTNQNSCSNHSSSGQETLGPQLIPIDFLWKGKGDLVYVTGSFCNWKQKFMMEQISHEIFHISLKLQPGLYQYKFVINNEWLCSNYAPTINENGIINNVVEVRGIQLPSEEKVITKGKDDYHTSKNVEITNSPNECHDNYTESFNMSNCKCFSNDDFTMINNVNHVNINHLLFAKETMDNPQVIKTGFIRRVRSKYISIIYISKKVKK